MGELRKIIVKVGTSTLTQGTKKLSRRYMLELVRQLAILHEEGKEILLVTSGAIAAGRELLKRSPKDRSLPVKQMFASVGQVELMRIWSELFVLFDIHVGQVLLTRQDFSDRKRYLNIRDTLQCLLKEGVLPIINENDTVATAEIKVGDNDNMAALVANLIGADLLILLTDQEGLYTADPRSNPDATLIPVVKQIDDSIFQLAGRSSSDLGTGGMVTKIEAAQVAARSGIPTRIVSSERFDVLLDVLAGKTIGTLFTTDVMAPSSRKRWLLSERRQGAIRLDAGAADKICHGGTSLLPSGVIGTVDSFERGAIVQLLSPEGVPIALGITNYGSEEIERIIGVHSDRIEELLGYSYGSEIVHRNDMVQSKGEKE